MPLKPSLRELLSGPLFTITKIGKPNWCCNLCLELQNNQNNTSKDYDQGVIKNIM